ncbi:hypothetical protein KQX54_014381 [Cotesia glomerata]|uniref:Uncharacterized protein n=1 Tax=Cotesia glomerata TaxID=32391 RepID=A0AAV7I922_COTGL|nr:hypothetical protein KQX54_014381 [Cotesia glomerata]
MPKTMYALIKWVGGDDDGQYSVGIDTSWIKYFDYDKFKDDAENLDKVFVIEWYETKNEPLGRWPCFDGIIVAVSDSIRVLNKKLDIFSGIKLPLKIISHDNGNVRTDEKRSANQDGQANNGSVAKKICFDNSSVEIIDGKEEVEIISDAEKKLQEPEIIIDAEKKKKRKRTDRNC